MLVESTAEVIVGLERAIESCKLVGRSCRGDDACGRSNKGTAEAEIFFRCCFCSNRLVAEVVVAVISNCSNSYSSIHSSRLVATMVVCSNSVAAVGIRSNNSRKI